MSRPDGTREVEAREPRRIAPVAAVIGDSRSGPLARAAQTSLQFLLVAAAIAVAGLVVVQLRLVVLPVILALFVATILMPPTDWLRSRGLRPAIAALCVMVVALGVVAGLTALLAPAVSAELGDLGTSLRDGVEEVGAWLAEGPLGISQAEIDQAIDDGLATLSDNTGTITQGVLSGAVILAELVAGLLLALVLLFFFLKDGSRIWGWFVDLLPPRHRDVANELGRRSWATLGGYLRGVALVALVDAVLIGIALVIVGVPLVLPLAVLTFFAAFFPLVGAVTAGLLAALVALVSNGVVAALIVVAAITLIQQLEGDIIYPVVVGRAIRLHPVAVLLALTAGGVVAGIVGALLAVPLTAVAWTIVAYLRGGERQRQEPLPEAREAEG